MEMLIVILLVGGGIMWLSLYSAQTRHDRELSEIRRDYSYLQSQVNWLLNSIAVRREVETRPREKPSEPVPPTTVAAPPPDPVAGSATVGNAAATVWNCPACNRTNPINSKYCINCGVRLPGSDVPEPVSPAAPPATQPQRSFFNRPLTGDWWGEFEQLAGLRWMTWVGVLILIAAAGFSVKAMYDMGWLSPWWRVILELVLGLVVMGIGGYSLRQRMAALGQGLIGLGLAVLYVAVYSAFSFHHLVSPAVEFVLVAVVTAAGMWISLRLDSMAIATLAVLGGFITPELVTLDVAVQHSLLTYVMLLNIGVLTVAILKRWLGLNIVAFIGTTVLFISWVNAYYSTALLTPTMVWLCAFYLLFMLLPFIYSMRSGAPLDIVQFLAGLLNATVMIAASAYFLWPQHPAVLGMISLLMSLCYLALAAGFKLRIPADRRSHNAMLALAIIFISLAVPLALGLNATLIVWAVEAPLLVLLGYQFDNRLIRTSGVVLLAVALLKLAIDHLPLHNDAFALFLTPEFWTALTIPLGTGIAALVHHFFHIRATESDRLQKTVAAISAGLLALLLINIELHSWFTIQVSANAANQQYLSWTTQLLVWVTGVALFMVAGICWGSRAARGWSVFLMLVVLVYGLWTYFGLLDPAGAIPGEHLLFGNYRFGASLFTLLVIFGLAWLHAAMSERLPGEERYLPTLLGISAGLLVLMLVTGETSRWFALACYGVDVTAQLLGLCWQTLVWALGAAGFLAAGIRWTCREARWAGLFPLLGGLVTGLRTFSMEDGPLLDPLGGGWLFLNLRFGAALALVLVLFLYGLALRRARNLCTGEEQQLATGLYVTADVLLLALLSMEAYRFFYTSGADGGPSIGAAQVALSIVWGVYALAFIIIGVYLDKRLMRLLALGLFGLTALKLIFIDLSHLLPVYRLLSSVALGVLMIITSLFYHRLEQRFAPAEDRESTAEVDGDTQ